MVDRPIIAPRRDELALSGDVLSHRVQVYLEDLAELENSNPNEFEALILQTISGINTANISFAQITEILKNLSNTNNLVSGLISESRFLLSDIHQIKSDIQDIKQLQTGGFNYGG